jgi:hypothetical protein
VSQRDCDVRSDASAAQKRTGRNPPKPVKIFVTE